MPGESEIEKAAWKWLLTGTGALVSSLGTGLATVAVLVLSSHIEKGWLLSAIVCLALCLVIAIWNGARATRNLRSKNSKLEDEILSLKSRPSPALSEMSDSDHVLLAVCQSEDDDSKIAEITGFSQIRIDGCLHHLRTEQKIEQHMEPWETPYHYILPEGRSYLISSGLAD